MPNNSLINNFLVKRQSLNFNSNSFYDDSLNFENKSEKQFLNYNKYLEKWENRKAYTPLNINSKEN
jgi:hypothetical protein